ncbi:MAG: hypothetical protein RMN24_15705 [Anaerolineae bacterium]|nr:hypothetical protein [Anaerolineae bacterium]
MRYTRFSRPVALALLIVVLFSQLSLGAGLPAAPAKPSPSAAVPAAPHTADRP